MNTEIALAVAQLVVPMLLPELAQYGARLDWRGAKSRMDVKLQKLIPFHWVEGKVQAVCDAVLDAVQTACQDTVGLADVTSKLTMGDVAGAERALLAMVRRDVPAVAQWLPAAA